jgi:hypothetical protein
MRIPEIDARNFGPVTRIHFIGFDKNGNQLSKIVTSSKMPRVGETVRIAHSGRETDWRVEEVRHDFERLSEPSVLTSLKDAKEQRARAGMERGWKRTTLEALGSVCGLGEA